MPLIEIASILLEFVIAICVKLWYPFTISLSSAGKLISLSLSGLNTGSES